eukprot:GHVU01131961.1.p1 GENE.GHVU01131961.1~~GHVU01131961.1.p1  ORF type:complete len:252 (+),score=22.38 GHVU01131961.1:41-796(+)
MFCFRSALPSRADPDHESDTNRIKELHFDSQRVMQIESRMTTKDEGKGNTVHHEVGIYIGTTRDYRTQDLLIRSRNGTEGITEDDETLIISLGPIWEDEVQKTRGGGKPAVIIPTLALHDGEVGGILMSYGETKVGEVIENNLIHVELDLGEDREEYLYPRWQKPEIYAHVKKPHGKISGYKPEIFEHISSSVDYPEVQIPDPMQHAKMSEPFIHHFPSGNSSPFSLDQLPPREGAMRQPRGTRARTIVEA